MHIVPLGPDAGKAVLKALRDGHVVALLCDRDIEGTGVEVDFFGERTTLPAGPATLALRTGRRAPAHGRVLPGRRATTPWSRRRWWSSGAAVACARTSCG